jgi:hypothetical protein
VCEANQPLAVDNGEVTSFKNRRIELNVIFVRFLRQLLFTFSGRIKVYCRPHAARGLEISVQTVIDFQM